jgi:hypothetical protein
MSKEKFMCSYFGNYYSDAYAKHLDEMFKGGFNTVVHCMPEEGVKFNRKALHNMTVMAYKQGMAVYADPWGVAGAFDGEAFNQFTGIKCLNNKIFTRHLNNWIEQVTNMPIRGIFWDNPKISNDCSCCDDVQFISYLTGVNYYTENIVCISAIDNLNQYDKIKSIAELEHVDDIGTDPYILYNHDTFDIVEYVTDWIRTLRNIACLLNKDVHIWLQGFNLPMGHEDIPERIYRLAFAYGIRNFGFWGFKACEALSDIRPANYLEVWDNICKLRTVR